VGKLARVRFRDKLAGDRFGDTLADLRFGQMLARVRSRPPKAAQVQLIAIWLVLAGALTGIWTEWARIFPSQPSETVVSGSAEAASATATDRPLLRDGAVATRLESSSNRLRTVARRGLDTARGADVLQSSRLSHRSSHRSGRAD